MGMNMLSAKKVKLHGMHDSRWTVKDQLLQYKVLLKLLERDNKALDAHAKSDLKNDKKQIKAYLKLVVHLRHYFKKVVDCDRQKIKNLLNEDQELKLAFQDLELHKITDHLQHENFTVRKRIDVLDYRQKTKEDYLVKLKLEEGDLETDLQYSKNVKSPTEVQIGIVTGKLQDMILKKEAAITVNTTYKTLTQLLRKDEIYYDSVLNTLRDDGREQCHCIIQTMKLGQLAVEFLDDRRTEFDELQAHVRHRNKITTDDLGNMRASIEGMNMNLRQLVKRDLDLKVSTSMYRMSRINIGRTDRARESVDLSLLKETLEIVNVEEMLPRLKENKRQLDRLTEISHRMVQRREELRQKVDEARASSLKKRLSLNSSDSHFIRRRAELDELIREQKEKRRTAERLQQRHAAFLNDVRGGLWVLTDYGFNIEPKPMCRSSTIELCNWTPFEQDVGKQLTSIDRMIGEILKVVPLTTKTVGDDAKETYLQFRSFGRRDNFTQVATEIEEEFIEDSMVATRQFIKWQSNNIVVQALKKLAYQ